MQTSRLVQPPGRPARAAIGRCLAMVLGLACAVPAARAQDLLPPGRVDLLLTVEQSRGDYREATPTRIRSTTLVARYRGAAWVGEVQVPWLDVRSGGPAGGLPGTVQAGHSTERGLGDIWLKLGLELAEFDTGRTGVDLTVKLKTHSGDAARGLGSGGTDLAAQVELARAFGPWVGFGHLGWRRTGDVPGYTPYRNPWYGQAGLSRPVSPAWELGGFVDWRAPIGRLGAVGESTVYAAWRDGGQRLQLTLTRGFAPASADWALGLGWRTRF